MNTTIQPSVVTSFMSSLSEASAVRIPSELDRWSNRLARLLMSIGAGQGTAVAVVLSPSVELVVARSAVSKSGAKIAQVDPASVRDGVEPLAAQPITVGITTKAHRDGLSDTIDWLLLDDLSTVRRYMTVSDADVTEIERAKSA